MRGREVEGLSLGGDDDEGEGEGDDEDEEGEDLYGDGLMG